MSTEVRPDPAPSDQAAPPASVTELIDQFRAGSQKAARTLYDRFSHSIRVVIRRNFLPPSAPLRRDMDSMDLLQEGWLYVFQELRRGGTFPDDDAFRGFALTVIANLFKKHYRTRVTTAKRSMNKEQAFNLAKHDTREVQPSPADQAATADEWLRLLASLPERSRTLVLAVRDGSSLAEAAQELGFNLRMAERIIEKMRQACMKRQSAQDA